MKWMTSSRGILQDILSITKHHADKAGPFRSGVVFLPWCDFSQMGGGIPIRRRWVQAHCVAARPVSRNATSRRPASRQSAKRRGRITRVFGAVASSRLGGNFKAERCGSELVVWWNSPGEMLSGEFVVWWNSPGEMLSGEFDVRWES